MTREEYLNQLKNNLLSLTFDEQQEALQYYSDYFEEANNDEKVIEELGSPEELSKTIIEKFANALVNSNQKKEDEENGHKATDFESTNVNYYEFEKNKVKSLAINIGAADIVMISGTKYCVETRGILKNDMNCYLSSEGVLNINNTKRININFWNHERKSRIVPRILITVPDSAELEKIKLAVGAGNFRTKSINLRFKEGKLDVGAGKLILDELFGGKINLRCGMGDLEYYGELKDTVNIDCGMGSVKLKLKGNPEKCSYDAKVGLGDFRFNDEKKSGVCKIFDNVRKETHFSVNCGMGSVSIEVK